MLREKLDSHVVFPPEDKGQIGGERPKKSAREIQWSSAFITQETTNQLLLSTRNQRPVCSLSHKVSEFPQIEEVSKHHISSYSSSKLYIELEQTLREAS